MNAIPYLVEGVIFLVVLWFTYRVHLHFTRQRQVLNEESRRAMLQAEHNDWYYGNVDKRNVIEGGKR